MKPRAKSVLGSALAVMALFSLAGVGVPSIAANLVAVTIAFAAAYGSCKLQSS